MTAARALVWATAVYAGVLVKMQRNYEEELRRMQGETGTDGDAERREAATDGLPPVPALIEPVSADAFVKLEAVAGRAAHDAVMSAAPGLAGWAMAEYIENEVRAAMRAFVSPPASGARRCAKDSGWCDGHTCTDHGIPCERADARPAPDLVSRMIDARNCLRDAPSGRAGDPRGVETDRAVAGALRWLDEGIEEGLMQRELHGALRALVAGEPHLCTCGHSQNCEGCSVGFEDRCRFEKALRSLLGVPEAAT